MAVFPHLGRLLCFVFVDASVNITSPAPSLAPHHVMVGHRLDLPVFTLCSDVT